MSHLLGPLFSAVMLVSCFPPPQTSNLGLVPAPGFLSCCSVCLECPSQIFAWPLASLQSGLCSHGTALERSLLATCLPLPLSSVLCRDTLSGLCSTYQYLKWHCVYFVPPLSLKCRLQNSCLYHLPPFPHTQSIVWHERYSVNI